MLNQVSEGPNAPNEVNVIIEIPAHSDPIKYEVDKDSGALYVDRLMSTAMHYPCNYGYIPNTLSLDGDPTDVLVITPFPLLSGCVITVRPIGMLNMTDEAGQDIKILSVPIQKITPLYNTIQKPSDLPQSQLAQISHFFEHYKDLEPNKWVTIEGFSGPELAKSEIENNLENFIKEKNR